MAIPRTPARPAPERTAALPAPAVTTALGEEVAVGLAGAVAFWPLDCVSRVYICAWEQVAIYQVLQITTDEVVTGLVTVQGQSVIVKVVALKYS